MIITIIFPVDLGRAECVDVCMGEELEKIGKSFGFSELSHVMELLGYVLNAPGVIDSNLQNKFYKQGILAACLFFL